jgi:hypothetical protein
VDFDVIFHLKKLLELQLFVRVLSQIVDTVIVNLNLHDLGMLDLVARTDVVLEVMDRQGRLRLLVGVCALSSRFVVNAEHKFFEESYKLLFAFKLILYRLILAQLVKADASIFFARASFPLANINQQRVRLVVKVIALSCESTVGLITLHNYIFAFLDIGVEENSML